MTDGRRAKGFERLGAVGASSLGLPRREARRLLLADTWRRVAGDAIVRRLTAVRVVRGTVEIEADPRWADDLHDVLPSLVSRLARCAPELGVRRYRLRIHGLERPAAACPIPEVPPAPGGPSER